jgi:hypothetical protein
MPPEFIYLLPPVGVLATVFVTVAIIAILLHLVFFWPRLYQLNDHLAKMSPVVLAISGTVFGLSVSFLANSVWINEDRAWETVYAEARSMRVMENYIEALAPESRDDLYKLIEKYGSAVQAEWPDMAMTGAAPEAEKALQEIYAAVIGDLAQGDRDKVLQQRILNSLDSLSAARQERLSMAQNIVSAGQWILVAGLGFLLLVMTASLHAKLPVTRALALGAITMAISFMTFVIVMHDQPFHGDRAIPPEAILRASYAVP